MPQNHKGQICLADTEGGSCNIYASLIYSFFLFSQPSSQHKFALVHDRKCSLTLAHIITRGTYRLLFTVPYLCTDYTLLLAYWSGKKLIAFGAG